MKKALFVLVLLSAVGILSYSNSFYVPFQFDGLGQIAGNPVIKSLENFAPVLDGHAIRPPSGSIYNNRRMVGYLSLALNYHFGGYDVVGYHVVNLAIHLINGFLVYLLLILTFRTPYFSHQQSAISNQPSANSKRQEARQAGRPAGSQQSADSKRQEATQAGKLSSSQADKQSDNGQQQKTRGNNPPSSPLRLRGDRRGLRFTDSRTLIALFAALLFVAHPIQTQAVTYIVQRFTSLATMFYLLSVVFYIKGRLGAQGNNPPLSPLNLRGDEGGLHHDSVAYRITPVAYYLFSLLSAVLAMKTKEIAFTLPVVIVLYEFFFFKSTLKKRLLFLLPLFLTIVIIPISVMGTHQPLGELLSDLSARTRVQTNIPRWDYLVTQMRVITTYIRLLFFPVNQNLDYGYPVYHSLSQPPVILSFLFLLSLFGLAGYLFYKSREHGAEGDNPPSSPLKLRGDRGGLRFRIRDSRPFEPYYRLIAFGIFWFFITLSVESSVIPIADVIFEHRMYLPSVGAFIAISVSAFVIISRICSRLRTGKIMVSTLSVLVVVLLAGATYTRNEVWRDPLMLWQDVLRKSPGNARAYNDLGYLYLDKGQTGKSIEYFRKALAIKPYYSNAHTNLGVAYYSRGWIDAAIKEFRTALALEPHGPDVAEDHHNLGIAFTRKGMLDEAISEYLAALKLAPRDAGIYNDLGVTYRQKGLTGKAIECFGKALDLDPSYVYARLNLAGAYESEGRHEEAQQQYGIARRLRQKR